MQKWYCENDPAYYFFLGTWPRNSKMVRIKICYRTFLSDTAPWIDSKKYSDGKWSQQYSFPRDAGMACSSWFNKIKIPIIDSASCGIQRKCEGNPAREAHRNNFGIRSPKAGKSNGKWSISAREARRENWLFGTPKKGNRKEMEAFRRAKRAGRLDIWSPKAGKYKGNEVF